MEAGIFALPGLALTGAAPPGVRCTGQSQGINLTQAAERPRQRVSGRLQCIARST
jgi:hypothetical protein